jgi:hypothetical protein
MLYFQKVEPEQGLVRNIVIPAVGIAILIPAVYTAFYPNPGAPLMWSPYVIVGWTLLGGIYLLARDARRQPIDLDYAFGEIGEEVPPGALATEPGPPAELATKPA